ncbi:flagellar biosynthesis protein FliQ [Ferroacidibacillus organovorans]|uniref:Flagellar biosynthetic protein FliQ n=1 Tax=Ferroacidibacillus organovorans TaxID=1765683 RepID=A0A162UXF1_9BACL|nr:flagellar biosynthesis protein FliQ [Ferroacidibacillus organovorans]KYP82116.1 EscS/YscS/HrcS family type III secretion system export apparatus protein [Ferroacidibacillus organovorans]OAG94451.1 EscS/YscS/HrcS family type III secretion system export apparatus protein [Ferroacidibacillus organovorans]OPG15665.1 flagellar biosynthetic protein FliQ [Ferroacidibacillus organovorans]
MNANFVVGLGQQVVLLILELAGPLLLVGLVVGLLISIFQATTQIQEQSLTFIPKIVAVIVVLFLAGPWMLSQITDFTSNILGNLGQFVN